MEETQQDALVAGRYELGDLLGTGGMSEVHAAMDHRLQRPVAVKTLKPEMAAREDVRRRFETEARWAARLTHPHAVAVYDTGEHDGIPYLVMERLPGETLHDRIAEGPVDPDWLRRTATDVLGALAAAHENGIVHRDIKPGNILITPEGRAKVADFGIAKSLGLDGDEPRTDLTRTGQLVGTPSYLAPERLDGKPADARSDIYALGVVLYEALTGRKPFSGATPLAVAFAVKHDDPVPLDELRPDADPALVAAIGRAMARDPAARFQTADEMAAALDPGATAVPSLGATQVVTADATVMLDRNNPTTVIAPASAVEPDVAPLPLRQRHPRSPRARRLTWSVLALAAVALIGLALVAASSRTSGGLRGLTGSDANGGAHADLVKQLRAVATRVEVGDGPKGPEAASRLRGIADTLSKDGDAGDDATSLLADAKSWSASGELFRTATGLVVGVLEKVPGVDASASAAPPPTEAPAVQGNVNVGPARGKGHKKHDD